MKGDEVRKLTLKEFEGIEINPNWLGIDILAAVVERASSIFDNEKKMKKKKDKGNEKVSDSENAEEHHGKKKKKKIKMNEMVKHKDQLVGQSKKKIMVLEQKRRETLQTRFSRGTCVKELSEILMIKGETEEIRVASTRECQVCPVLGERILRKERKRKKPDTEADHEEDEECHKKNMKKKVKISDGPSPPPPLPIAFREALERLAKGKTTKEVNLVLQKGLFKTDISPLQNRLSLPSRNLLCSFLREDEKKGLQSHTGKNVYSIEVDIIEPSLERGKAHFRKWVMKKKDKRNASTSYVLTKTWNSIVRRNSLRIGDVVQIWSARVEEKLCFLLVRLRKTGDKVSTSDPKQGAEPSSSSASATSSNSRL